MHHTGPRKPTDKPFPTPSAMRTRLMRLEERVVLDAAVPTDGAGGTDHATLPASSPAEAGPPAAAPVHGLAQFSPDGESPVAAPGTPTVPARLLIISDDIDQADALAAARAGHVQLLQLDHDTTTLEDLLAQIQLAVGDTPVESIALATHGRGPGELIVTGDHVVDADSLGIPSVQAFWRGIAQCIEPGGRIDLLGCDVADNAAGARLLHVLEQLTGVNLAASDDPTGNEADGGDWVLESDRIDVAGQYFDAGRLSQFRETLADTRPTISDTDPGRTARGQGPAVVVDPNISVSDADSTDLLRGALVRIRNSPDLTQDELSFTPMHGVTGSYNAATGELLLTGDATAAEYQDVLRSVTYRNTSATPDTTARTIHFIIGDDFDGYRYNTANGHYYAPTAGLNNYLNASTAASTATLDGLRGYLPTVTGTAENTFVTSLFPDGPQGAWLGASDSAMMNNWRWTGGPENGRLFWIGGPAPGGSPQGGYYNNWAAGQPSMTAMYDYAAINPTGSAGTWITLRNFDTAHTVIEFGGAVGDTEGDLLASVTLNVTDPNQAPVLDAAGMMSLDDINEDDFTSAGTTVADIVATAGGDRITDADGDPEGIAIVGLDTSHGAWQYSLDGGSTWATISGVATSNALLLRSSDLLRFVPDADYNGTLNAAVTFRAWDQLWHDAGDYVDTSTSGGATSFSTATETAGITVHNVNDAPVLDDGYDLHLNDINEDDLTNGGTTIADLLASAGGNPVSDVDTGALAGIAVIGADTTHGAWQYSTDGGATWLDLGSVSNTNALLLRDSDLIRFLPEPDYNGTLDAALSFVAWDQTSGSAGSYADTAAGGSTGAFSSASDAASLLVHNVNDGPTLANPLDDGAATVGELFEYSFATNAFTDIDPGDVLSYSATLADGSPLPAWLVFDPATRRFSGTPDDVGTGSLSIRVRATDGQGAWVSDDFIIMLSEPPAPPPDPPAPDDPPASDDPPVNPRGDSGSSASGGGDAGDNGGDAGGDAPGEPGAPAEEGLRDMLAEDDSADSDAGDFGEAPAASDAGGESSASGDAGDAGNAAAAEGPGQAADGGASGPTAVAQRREDDPLAAPDEDDLGVEIGELTSQIRDAMFTGDLLTDDTQPIEFRAAWDTILGAYAGTGEELTTYLESAFRTVTESAFVHQAADHTLDAVQEELTLAREAGLDVDVDVLIEQVLAARDDVRQASSELEAAILAAAEAGQNDRFDRVLEDVISASLYRLMVANEQLFVNTEALAAATAQIRAARVNDAKAIATDELVAAARQARDAARAEINEMRKSWDRVAQDVFAAFVTRLVAQKGAIDNPLQ